jgi:hypothetical protein
LEESLDDVIQRTFECCSMLEHLIIFSFALLQRDLEIPRPTHRSISKAVLHLSTAHLSIRISQQQIDKSLGSLASKYLIRCHDWQDVYAEWVLQLPPSVSFGLAEKCAGESTEGMRWNESFLRLCRQIVTTGGANLLAGN